MNIAKPGVLRIGAWRVDPALDQISRNARVVKLEPRSMQVLVCLAERAGQVVSINELLDEVWKDVVVTPDSVYQAVAGLRRALGDGAKDSAYIVNVLRRGYRLVAPVSPWVDASDPIPTPTSVNPPADDSRTRWRSVALVSTLALAIAIAYADFQKHLPSKSASIAGPDSSASISGMGQSSVAVLPFVDMSSQKDQEYFADGLSEVIIDQLSMIPGLHVPARTSSFYFKGKAATVPEIAKALGVAYVLEGTVRKSGDSLRITLKLVHAKNGYQIWSETFDRPLTDLSRIQDEIGGVVVQVLKVSILSHDAMEAARTANIEAYILYFRAESNVVSNGVADYEAAAEQLQAAVRLDPQFAAAWARLALVTLWRFDVARLPGTQATRASPTAQACAVAYAAADRASKLNATLVAPYRAKGVVLQYCDNDWSGAETAFKRALELQPGSSDTLRSYAWLALAAGRPGQAIQLAQHALSIDPLNAWSFAALGDALFKAGQIADAEGAYRKAVALNPTSAGLHALLAGILLSTNKASEAVAEAELEPDATWREAIMLFALDAVGRKSDADRAIAAYERNGANDPRRIAAFYACRHDVESSIKWLSRVPANNRGVYHDLPYAEACFKNLASEPRYLALLQK